MANQNKKSFFEMLVNKKSSNIKKIDNKQDEDNKNIITEEDVKNIEKYTKTLNVADTKSENKNNLYYIIFKAKLEDKLDEINSKIKLMKTSIREKIKNSVKKEIEELVKTKQEKVFLEFLDKAYVIWDKVTTVLVNASKWIINQFKKVANLFIKVSKYIKNLILPILNFLTVPFKLGWKFVDSFMNSVSPKSWEMMKKVASTIWTAVSWAWNIGKKMLEYAWEGVKTIFKFGYEVMVTVGKALYKGAKAVFSWWFKMLVNTLFSITNPLLFVVNAAIFLGISSAIFVALSSLVSVIIDLATPLFKGLFEIGGNLLNWVWKGLTIFWDWIKEKYEGSWLQEFVDEYIINGIYSWFMNLSIVKKIISYVKIGYQWIKNNGLKVLNFINKGIETIKKYSSEFPGETLLVKFINILNSNKWLEMAPGTKQLIKYLNKRFAFLPGIIQNNFSVPENILTMKENIKIISKRKIQNSLEYEALRLTKQGKSYSDIEKFLTEITIPKLKTDIKRSEISPEELNSIIKNRILEADKIYKNKGVGSIDYISVLEEDTKLLSTYLNIIRKVESGRIDPTDPVVIKNLDILRDTNIKNMRKILDKEGRQMPLTEKSISDIVKQNVIIEQKILGSSTELSIQDFKQNLESANYHGIGWLNTVGDVPKIWIDPKNSFIMKIGKSAVATATSTVILGERFVDNAILAIPLLTADSDSAEELRDMVKKSGRYNMIETAIDKKKQEYESKNDITGNILNSSNFKKFANGGISMPDPSNIKPLNDLSAQFVREKVQNIEKTNTTKQKNKEKTDRQNNITIIDTYIAHIESYETYTISQLSRGLLSGS